MIIKFEYNNTEFNILGTMEYNDIDDYDMFTELSIGKGYFELFDNDSPNSIVYLNMDLESIQQLSAQDTFYTKYEQKILVEIRNDKLKDLGL